MMSKWQYLLGRFNRQLWARSALYCLAGVATALIAALAGPYVPLGDVAWLGAGAVKQILTIIASSMLAVATFSLSTMVSAFAAASSSTTPRAAQLLIEDTSAQRALSTFVGAFLFSIVGLVALSAGAYNDSGRVLLFVVTLVMIGAVVATLLSWIDTLPRFGRVAETIDRVEAAAKKAIVARAGQPRLGGAATVTVPDGARPVSGRSVGYVRYIDVSRLQQLAESKELRIHVVALPGTFADARHPLAHVEGVVGDGDESDELLTQLASAFVVGGARTFEQDPRFGLIVLTEIAIRALSPAINDPGTAIDVIGTVVRLLSLGVATRSEADEDSEPPHPRVHVPEIEPAEFIDDVFNPIARDGAGLLEVCIKLQRGLQTLQHLGDERLGKAARQSGERAMRRAEQAMTLRQDYEALQQAVDADAA